MKFTPPPGARLFDIRSNYRSAKAVVFGAPFDGTTSYRPGARFAPRTIRSESYGFETFSPYLNADLSTISFFDAGDLELPFGDKQKVLASVKEMTSCIIRDKKLPIMIGGEHLISLGAVCSVAQHYDDLCIIQFDAHADLRDDYIEEKFSHATVLRRCHDLLGDDRIFQFGIRSGTQEEFEFAQEHTFCNRFDLDGLEHIRNIIADRPVYVTIDLDVLDPSVFPGTGTPEAGGVSFNELLSAIHFLESLNIVGADICELSPPYDPSGISVAAAIKILRELLLVCLKNK